MAIVRIATSITLHDADPILDRLPTFSASQALEDLNTAAPVLGPIRTGVPAVDDLFGSGLELGKVTELWGPCGSGKTAVAYVSL